MKTLKAFFSNHREHVAGVLLAIPMIAALILTVTSCSEATVKPGKLSEFTVDNSKFTGIAMISNIKPGIDMISIQSSTGNSVVLTAVHSLVATYPILSNCEPIAGSVNQLYGIATVNSKPYQSIDGELIRTSSGFTFKFTGVEICEIAGIPSNQHAVSGTAFY
jgi:hypothetical protein